MPAMSKKDNQQEKEDPVDVKENKSTLQALLKAFNIKGRHRRAQDEGTSI